jgi:hypothetical protein
MNKLIIICVFLVAFSCSRTQDKTNDYNEQPIIENLSSDNHPRTINLQSLIVITEFDTILRYTINGETKDYLLNRWLFSYLKDFPDVIDKYGYSLTFTHQDSLDITGDGNIEQYNTTIKQKGDGFVITNTIKQTNTIIWLDSLFVENEYWAELWDDSVYYELLPYSSFYLNIYRHENFVDDFRDLTSEENIGLKSFFISYLNKGYDDTEYWEKYLDEFRGRTITKMCKIAPSVYMWSDKLQKFVPVYVI